MLGIFPPDSAGSDLIIKGIRPVEGLEFNINMNESARVLWNSPSFVSDDVINLLYDVIISDNNTVVNDTTSELEYEVLIDLRLCSIYTVNVTAYDDKYTSDSSIIQKEYIGEYFVSIIEKYIYVEESGNFMVAFEIMLIGRCHSFITGITKLNVPDGKNNQEMEHNTEYVEPEGNNVIFNYTVHDVAPQQNYTFECLIKDKLNTTTANDTEKFTTNHVQNIIVNPDNEVLHVLCKFAKNSNASGCGLNFTKREDTTVTLYSKQIVKNHNLNEAEGYISLPDNIRGNLTVIAFDVLNNEVSDKPAVIYNGLPEIPAKPIPENTVIINNTYMYFSSSSYHSDSNSDNVQSTAILSVQMSSTPTIEEESTKASNELIILVISGCVLFICCVMIIIITGIVMNSKYRRTKQKQRKGVFEMVSPMTQYTTYAQQTELILRVARFGELERFIEESDHESTNELLDGHIPNPPSIPSQSPPLSQPSPPYSPSLPLTYPAVTQTSSDTSLQNHRPSCRSQTSCVNEDNNLLHNGDIHVPYHNEDKTEDNESNLSNYDEIDVEQSGTTPTNQPSQQFQEPALETRDVLTSVYHSTSTTEMKEIPSVTQKSTNVVSTPFLSKDVVPHYADIELSHKRETYDLVGELKQVVYSTVISDKQLTYTSSEESVTTQTDKTKNKFVYSTPQTNYPQGMCVTNSINVKPVQVACLECVSTDSTIIKEETELRGIRDPTLVVNNSHQETTDVSDGNVINIEAVPTPDESKSEGTLVEVQGHVPHQIITERVESEGLDDTYIHKDVRQTIDNMDSSLVTIDQKTSVEGNEPNTGFVDRNGVISRKCITASSSTNVSHLVKPPEEISKEFDSCKKTGKLKSTLDIDEDFLDSVEKQYFKETTTDIAHDPQSEIIQPSLCSSDTYIKPLHPTSSEPPSQISPPQTQTLSIKTTSFSCIDKTKQEIHDEIPYVHNSQATSNSVSVLQDDNYSLKDCGTLASHVINSLSLMRKDANDSVDGMKEDKRQKPIPFPSE